MAYPLSERPERQKNPESNNKPFLTAEREAIEEGVAELVQWEPVQQALRTPVIRAIGGGLRTFMQGATEFGEYLKEEARQPIETPQDIGTALVGKALIGVEALTEKTQRGFEMYATGAPIQNPITGESLGNVPNLNVDPAVARFAGGAAAETLLGAGVSKAAAVLKNIPPATPPMQPALAGGGGGLKLNFSKPRVDVPEAPQVMPITVDPRRRAPGMVQDVAQQPEFRAALDRRTQALEEVRANIARREAQGKTAAKYKKELAGKGSTLDYDPNDPIVFEKARYKVYDPLDPERTAHQHHLFAKAQSYPFVEKMEELIAAGIADEDDLVNMFAWADMLDVTMGNTRKNMLDAPGRSHIDAAPGSTAFDKTRNIHTLLKEFDLEIPAKKVREKVKDAQNATELMDIFNDYIIESVKPQKRVAQRIVDDFIVRHRATLPKDQLSMFDDLVSKLGGRYKPN